MYNHQNRQNTVSSAISRTSRRSDDSYSSQSTAATSVCDDPGQPPLTRQLRHTSTPRYCTVTHGESYSSRSSCGSSRRSEPRFYEEPEEYGEDDYVTYFTPSYTNPSYPPSFEAIPTTPQDFATYFPSQRRLTIAHDPSAADRAMNLVISTELLEGNRKIHMQLFHLRMHDILTRAFSLRRYCRDSGREVCHSIARAPTSSRHPKLQRPKLQRSMSSAFATVKRTSIKRADSWGSSKSAKSAQSPPTLVIPDRHDSGYATNSDDESDFSDPELDNEPPPPPQKPSSTIKLEFSNYAHVDLRRRGSGASKHWDFEYWGHPYSWKRTADGAAQSYHLVQHGAAHPVAHVVPEVLTTAQSREDAKDGAWIPRCSLWISDTSMLREGDVADVVVATGLMALVDDAARGFNKRPAFKRQVSIPMSPVKLDLELVRPREMMRQVFRRGSKDTGTERPGTARSTGSPLKFLSPVEAF